MYIELYACHTSLIYVYLYLVLPNSKEYQTALKLEMWKLSEEEAFKKQMKTKEVAYFDKLEKEWSKREVECQRIFAHKVNLRLVYVCLCINVSKSSFTL